jgi:hypothetical protein
MNDIYVWGATGALAVLIPLAIYFLPARTRILIDTPTSTARAEVRPLWGLGAAMITRALPKKLHGTPLPSFGDVGRVGHALITPGIVEVAYAAAKSLLDMKPKVAKLELRLNLADTARTRVVQTAVQAALAAAPAAFRQNVIITQLDQPGAELSAQFEVMASPAKLNGIYQRLKSARATQEFRRRLTKKSKPDKRLPDVQVR